MPSTNLSQLSIGSVEAAAYALRKKLDVVWDDWLDFERILEVDLAQLIPDFDLSILPLRESEYLEALTIPDVNRIIFDGVVYNSLLSGKGRYRYSAAHEIGHLILHRNESIIDIPSEYSDWLARNSVDVERQADRFAAFFMLPPWIVEKYHSVDALSRATEASSRASEIAFAKYNPHKLAKMNIDWQFVFDGMMRIVESGKADLASEEKVPQLVFGF